MKQDQIKGIIFDYGGTIDTNGVHWSEVIREAYVQCGVPVGKEEYRNAYRFTEKQLAIKPFIKPGHDFKDVLKIKIGLQFDYLNNPDKKSAEKVALACYETARETIAGAVPVLEKLTKKYPLVLVSNFYGNLQTVLTGFNIRHYFKEVVESSLVGVRKPDPAIFRLGVEALRMEPEKVAVIGDSYTKDMEPAMKVGCLTVWLKGKEWEEPVSAVVEPDFTIADLSEVLAVFMDTK